MDLGFPGPAQKLTMKNTQLQDAKHTGLPYERNFQTAVLPFKEMKGENEYRDNQAANEKKNNDGAEENSPAVEPTRSKMEWRRRQVSH